MQSLLAIFNFLGSHMTKILGGLTATVSYLNGVGIIPNGQLKYYTAVLAVLTIWRGVFSGNAYVKGVEAGAAQATSPFLPPNSQLKVNK